MITVWSRALAAGCNIISPEVLHLAEAPGNHSDLAKIEEKGGYIALMAAYDTGAEASGTKTNKQTNIYGIIEIPSTDWKTNRPYSFPVLEAVFNFPPFFFFFHFR